jgi:uncharacterized repeat protein (TIGR03809 family)
MTHRLDVARGRNIVARWCDLAERRLEYLTELSETGRWRRYHSEGDFLENIQDARTAVETWRDLLTREASRDNSAVDMSWLDRGRATLAPAEMLRDQLRRLRPQPVPTPAEPVRRDTSAAGIVDVFSDEALTVRKPALQSGPTTALEQAANEVAGLAPSIAATRQRYPSLRNAL